MPENKLTPNNSDIPDKQAESVSKSGTPITANQPADESKDKNGTASKNWQERLLPLMIVVLVGLTSYFFFSTYLQISYLHRSILDMPDIDINPAAGESLLAGAQTFDDQYKARDLEIRSKMEAYIVAQRYHQNNVLVMSGLWIRYLGFITGMILAMVGAAFVLGKIREPRQQVEGKFLGIEFLLGTTSPGIIMIVMGVVLMFATITDRDYYKVSDGNIYLSYTRPTITVTAEPTDIGTLIPPEEFDMPSLPSFIETPSAIGP